MLAISGFLGKQRTGFQANDDGARRQLADLDRRKGDVIRRMDAIETRYGVGDGSGLASKIAEMERALSDWEDLDAENDALSDEMDGIFSDYPDISDGDYPNY